MTLDLAGNLTLHRRPGGDRGRQRRSRVVAGVVHPGRPAGGAADAHAGARDTVAGIRRRETPTDGRPGRDRWRRPPLRDTTLGRPSPMRYLDRLARRMANVGTSLCLGIDPDPDALPDGFPRTVEGVGRFAELVLDAAGPFAAAVKVNVAFFERWGSDGVRALERLREPHPGGPAVHRGCQAGRHRLHRRPVRGRAVRRAGRGRPDRKPVPRLGGHRAAPRPARSLRVPAVPDVQPGRARAPGPGRRGRRRVGCARGAAGAARRAPRQRLGAPSRHGRPRRGRHGARGAGGGARHRARACRSWCPAWAPRAATPRPRCGTARRSPVRRASHAGGALLVNVSRGISGAATGAADPRSRDRGSRAQRGPARSGC